MGPLIHGSTGLKCQGVYARCRLLFLRWSPTQKLSIRISSSQSDNAVPDRDDTPLLHVFISSKVLEFAGRPPHLRFGGFLQQRGQQGDSLMIQLTRTRTKMKTKIEIGLD